MTETPKLSQQLLLRSFDPTYAHVVAGWVQTEEELLWLAPSTTGPLTAAKIVAWKRPNGDAFLYVDRHDGLPVAYGELNPMRREPDHLWAGHIIVSPRHRGRGIGQAFVQAMLGYAFGRRCANRVSLIVFPGNGSAIHCYRRVGFRVAGEEFHRFGRRGTKHRLLRLEIKSPQP